MGFLVFLKSLGVDLSTWASERFQRFSRPIRDFLEQMHFSHLIGKKRAAWREGIILFIFWHACVSWLTWKDFTSVCSKNVLVSRRRFSQRPEISNEVEVERKVANGVWKVAGCSGKVAKMSKLAIKPNHFWRNLIGPHGMWLANALSDHRPRFTFKGPPSSFQILSAGAFFSVENVK